VSRIYADAASFTEAQLHAAPQPVGLTSMRRTGPLGCCSSRSRFSPLASSVAARAEARAKAASAFTALANVFFVSLVALIPHTGVGIPVLVMSTVALLNTVQMGRDLWRSEGVPDTNGY
jgi:hypothetical protein